MFWVSEVLGSITSTGKAEGINGGPRPRRQPEATMFQVERCKDLGAQLCSSFWGSVHSRANEKTIYSPLFYLFLSDTLSPLLRGCARLSSAFRFDLSSFCRLVFNNDLCAPAWSPACAPIHHAPYSATELTPRHSTQQPGGHV